MTHLTKLPLGRWAHRPLLAGLTRTLPGADRGMAVCGRRPFARPRVAGALEPVGGQNLQRHLLSAALVLKVTCDLQPGKRHQTVSASELLTPGHVTRV